MNSWYIGNETFHSFDAHSEPSIRAFCIIAEHEVVDRVEDGSCFSVGLSTNYKEGPGVGSRWASSIRSANTKDFFFDVMAYS